MHRQERANRLQFDNDAAVDEQVREELPDDLPLVLHPDGVLGEHVVTGGAVVGEALSRTARSVLGLAFTPELEDALGNVYAELSSVMMEAAGWDYRLAA